MAEHFPRQFGKYVLLKSLARGGMGEIYLATSGQPGGLSKLCVIKKVITQKTDRAKINRFLDEAKVVLRLSHANLVSTFDAGDVSGELFIAMELVEGKDLREIWNRCVRTRTRIPVDVALVIVREIARALAFVHAYGALRLVHRDVAPPNILISYYGEVKLTDFGLARSTLKQEHTAPGVVFGRASYLAPEQARGEVADARTDVYALGIVLWELLTGQPYLQLAGLDPATSLSLVRNPQTQPPSSRAPWIAPELDAIVLKALSADRATRFQTAEKLRRSLSDVMTRVAPRADSERVAEFLRGLYRDMLVDESTERERLLAACAPLFGGDAIHAPSSSMMFVDEPVGDLATTASAASFPVRLHADVPVAAAAALDTSSTAPAFLDDVDAPTADDGEASWAATSGDVAAMAAEPTVRAVPPLSDPFAVGEPPKESLHQSALRARAVSGARRPVEDASGADLPTTVWRKKPPRADPIVAQTFVGRVIDNRYRIRHRIGEGGMGTVYAAEHVEIGKNVAVKILHRVFSEEDQLVERFRREARAASRVGDPHIVDVTDFGTTEEGCAYFVMEFLEGMDLADVLVQEGRLVPSRAMRIGVQMCQALEAAHTVGIIHRDLKPENIFLIARDGQADFVKVLDFGIARSVAGESWNLTNPGMAMGTPEYMAPEQSQGRPADRRTDVYAIGALLFEMVTGAAPFKSDSPARMLEAKRRPPESLRKRRGDIPVALDAVIMRTLDPDPDRRPQTMAQLEYELTKILGGRPQAVADLLRLREPTAQSPGTLPLAAEADANGGEYEDAPSLAWVARLDPDPHKTGRKSAYSSAVSASATASASTMVTPPPDRVVLSAPVVEPPPRVAPPDVEKLLEADLSPAPAPRRADSGAFSRPPPSRAPTLHGVGILRVPTTGAAADGPRHVATPYAWQVPDAASLALAGGVGAKRKGRSGVVALLLLLPLAAGLIAWTMNREIPAPLVAWLDHLRSFGGDAAMTSRAALRFSSPPARPEIEVVTGPAGDPVARLPRAGMTPPPRGDVRALSPSASKGTTHILPEIVPSPAADRAREAMAAGAPDDAVTVLRSIVARGDVAARPVLADALVASGWKDAHVYRWNPALRKAREALSVVDPREGSHGAHALLGEAQFALGDFSGALAAFTKALAENPRDARLRRRVIRSRRQLHPAATPSASPAPEPASEE